MADLVIRIRGDVDVSQLVGLTGTAEDLAKKLKSLEAAADDAKAQDVAINIKTTVRGSGQIKDATTITDKLDDSTQKLTNTIGKLTNAEQGSIASARAVVAVTTQQLNAVERNSPAWSRLTAALAKANEEYNKARGIQKGSVTQLQQQIDYLRGLANSTKQTAEQTDRLNQAIASLESRQRRQKGIQEGSISDLRAQKAALEASINATNRYTDPAKFRRLQEALKGVTRELQKGRSAAQIFNETMQKVANVRLAIATVGEAFNFINAQIGVFVQRQKQVESFNLALKNIGLSASEVSEAFGQAYDTAQALGAPLQAVEKSYKRMLPALQDIGISAEDSDKFIRELSARTITLGLNSEQSGRYMEAFAQVLSKGKLSGEELNQQISELDGSLRGQLADSLGIATERLTEMVETGQVTSKTFVDAFLRMSNGSAELEERIKRGDATIQQLQNSIGNIDTKNIEKIGDAFEPTVKAIIGVQREFALFVQTLTTLKGLKEISTLINEIAEGFLAFAKALRVVAEVAARVVEIISALFGPLVNLEVLGVSLGNIIGLFGAALLGLLAAKGVIVVLKLITAEVIALAAAMGAGTAAAAAYNIAIGRTGTGSGAAARGVAGVGQAAKTTAGNVATLAGAQVVADKGFKSLGGAAARTGGQITTSGGAVVGYTKNATNAAAQTSRFGGFVRGLGGSLASAGRFLMANKVAFGVYGLAAIAAGQLVSKAADENKKLAEATKEVNDVAKAAAEASKVYDESLKKQVETTQQGAQGAKAFSKELGTSSGAAEFLGLSLDGTNRRFVGFVDGTQNADKEINKLQASTQKAAGGILTLGSVQSRTSGQLQSALPGLQATSVAQGRLVQATRERIKALEAEGKGTSNQANSLRTLLGAQESSLRTTQKQIAAVNEEITRRIQQGEAIGTVTERLKVLQQYDQQLAKGTKLIALEREADIYGKLAGGIYTASEAEAARLGAEQGLIKANLESKQNIIRTLDQEIAKTGTLTAEQQQQYNEAVEGAATYTAALAKNQEQIRQGYIKAFTDAINAAQALGDKTLSVSDAFRSAADSLVSLGASGVQALESLASQVGTRAIQNVETEIQARINGVNREAQAREANLQKRAAAEDAQYQKAIEKVRESGATELEIKSRVAQLEDARQRRAAEFENAIGQTKYKAESDVQALEIQGQQRKQQVENALIKAKTAAINAEYQFELIKNQLAAQRQQTEIQIAKLRLEAEAAIAKQAGQNDLAARLTEIIPAYDRLLQYARVEAELGQVVAGYKRQQAIDSLTIANKTGEANEALDIAKLEGIAAQTNNFAKYAASAAESAGLSAGSFDQVAKADYAGAIQKGEKAALEFKKTAEKSAGQSKLMAEGFAAAGTELKAVNGFAEQLLSTLQKIVAITPSGGARAFGGPVSAGQQYTVNDGGGREAFVNSFGRFSMLPTGRNIQWTAPTSGFVVPAHLVDTFRQAQTVKSTNISRSIGNRVSGNLIGQASTSSSNQKVTSSQRIVNNVTIQSQQPVTDASRLMTELARNRRRIRL